MFVQEIHQATQLHNVNQIRMTFLTQTGATVMNTVFSCLHCMNKVRCR